MQLPSKLRLGVMLAVFCFGQPIPSNAQTKPATGTVSGCVTIGGKPAQGVRVLAFPNDNGGQPRASAQAKTDAEGQYRLTGLPAGSFKIHAAAREYVSPGEEGRGNLPGRSVTLGAGEQLEGQDLTLERGGVITGRVTTAAGRSLIEENIKLFRVEAGKVKMPFYQAYTAQPRTDDRGIYRVYGLPAGRYLVAAGYGEDEGAMHNNSRRGRAYKLTYHPDTADEAQAKVIEVGYGSEAGEVDIKLGASSRGHTVTVRVLEAETERPVPDLRVGYGIVQGRSSFISPSGGIISTTDSRGEMRFEGVLPGRYAAFLYGRGEGRDSDYYAEPQPFEVGEGTETRLKIVARRGLQVSGNVVLEGVTDAALLARAKKLRLYLSQQGSAQQLRSPYSNGATVATDLSFRMSGIEPSQYRLYLSNNNESRGFALARVEHNGAVLGEKFEINEALSGLRVVLKYGDARIVGQIQVTGGVLPPETRIQVLVFTSGSTSTNAYANPDAQGRFMVEHLVPGVYELRATAFAPTTQIAPNAAPPTPVRRVIGSANQQIIVGSAGDTTITVTLDLSAQGRRQ